MKLTMLSSASVKRAVRPASPTVSISPPRSLDPDGVPLPQPRLVTDGDVKGGRYVSMVVDLVVGHGSDPNRRDNDDD
jgi:hypothetical protein